MKDGCVNNGRNMRGNGVKPDSWSNGKFPNVKIVKPPITSWWIASAQPDARDAFMEAAHQRDLERERASNAIAARQVARFNTFANPIRVAPKHRHERDTT